MDFTFHALTGLAISKGATGKYLLWASIFSVLPDAGALPYKYYKFKSSSKKTFVGLIKDFTMPNKRGKFYGELDKVIYRSTHSLFSLIPAGLLALMISENYWWVYLLSYFSHFLVDAVTHEKGFSQMPFYPLSNWSISGKAWSINKWVFVTFWSILILVLIIQMMV